jgi:hypothetical protein
MSKKRSLFYRSYSRLWGRQKLVNHVAKHLDYKIAAGPFRGMSYSVQVKWGNPGNMFIGTYEKELTPYIEQIEIASEVIFDIGASEGYYAVGLARRYPECQVLAWETNEESQKYLLENACRNGVENRLVILSKCTESDLCEYLTRYAPRLTIVDIEGAELTLCSERCIERSLHTIWIIECHSEIIVSVLTRRLEATHSVTVVRNENRTPRDIMVDLPFLLPNDHWRLLNEGRPFPTPWIVAKPTLGGGT